MLQESRADECVQTTHKLVSACFKVVGILSQFHVLTCILVLNEQDVAGPSSGRGKTSMEQLSGSRRQG